MHDEDDLLAGAFNDFATDADRSLRVTQPGAIRGAALRRRRVRTVATTLVATVLVGVSVGAIRDGDRVSVTLTVTANNRSSLASGRLFVRILNGGEAVTISPADWTAHMWDLPTGLTGPVDGGGSTKFTLILTMKYPAYSFSVLLVQVDENAATMHDADPQNNSVEVKDFIA